MVHFTCSPKNASTGTSNVVFVYPFECVYQENYEENGQTKKSCQICKAILKLRVKKLGP